MSSDIGECVVRREGDDLYIEAAPPRVWISVPLLHEIVQGKHHPAVSYVDGILTIRAKNQTVVYRIRPSGIPPWQGGDIVVIGEWPD